MSNEKNGYELSYLDSSSSPLAKKDEVSGNPVAQENRLCGKWLWLELIAFTVIVLVVWGLLVLPFVYFEREISKDSDDNGGTGGTGTLNDTNMTTDTNSTMCPGQQLYMSDGFCRDQLLSRLSCIPGYENVTNITVVPIFPDQAALDTSVQLLLTGGITRVNPPAACAAVIDEFLCLYYYALCLDGVMYTVAKNECLPLRDEVCTVASWQNANGLIVSLDLPSFLSLPACEDLPDTETVESGCGASGSAMPLETCDLECSDGFYCDDELLLCRATCADWEIYPHSRIVALDTLAICVGFFSAATIVALFIVSILRWRTMFSFPNIFVIYPNLSLSVLIVVLLVQYTDRDGLYCSHKALTDTADDSTDFCEAAGSVLYYVLFQISLWWVFHVVVQLFDVTLPATMHNIRKNHCLFLCLVHCLMVVVGVLLPLMPVLRVHTNGGYQITRSPAFFCFADETEDTFYVLTTPIIILTMIGIPIFIANTWFTFKGRSFSELVTIYGNDVKTAFIHFYFAIYSVLVIATLTLESANSPRFGEELEDYLLCESTGVPDEPCPRDFEDYSFPRVSGTAYFFIGLVPVTHLLFAINYKVLKRYCCGQRGKFKPKGDI